MLESILSRLDVILGITYLDVLSHLKVFWMYSACVASAIVRGRLAKVIHESNIMAVSRCLSSCNSIRSNAALQI